MISAWLTTSFIDHRVAPPTSIYSMKRTSAPTRFPNSSRSTNSSSLNPRITTELIFTLANPDAAACSIPAMMSA